jgi:hypothetical protein
MDVYDPRRFLDVRKCKKFRASNAVELTYWDGSTERVNRYYPVASVEMIDHPNADLFRRVLMPPTYRRSL